MHIQEYNLIGNLAPPLPLSLNCARYVAYIYIENEKPALLLLIVAFSFCYEDYLDLAAQSFNMVWMNAGTKTAIFIL